MARSNLYANTQTKYTHALFGEADIEFDKTKRQTEINFPQSVLISGLFGFT